MNDLERISEMVEQKLLSIIIPVYNVEKYITEMLDSCLNQDLYKDYYEIICVDDGSRDNTTVMIERAMAKSSNIKLVKQENSGVSVARNRGLDIATGKYIWFVDGDDLVKENVIGKFIDVLEKENADFLVFGFEHFTDKLPEADDTYSCSVCDNLGDIYAFLYSNGGGSACRHIYSKQFLIQNRLCFKAGMKYSEDVLFCFKTVLYAKKVVRMDCVGYFYRQRAGSALHSNNTDDHIISMATLADEYNAIGEDNTGKWREIAFKKRNFAVKALLFSVMQKGDVSVAKKTVSELKQKGYYPYPLMLRLFVGNESLTQFIINAISFLFPFKPYYLLCVRLNRFVKGKNK